MTMPTRLSSTGCRAGWRRAIAAGGAALAGLTTLAAQLSAHAPGAILAGGAAGPSSGAAFRLLGIAGGLGLLALARALWAGKRRALDLAVLALVILTAVRFLAGLGVVDTAIELALAALLAANRDAFPRGGARAGRAARISATLMLGAATGAYASYAAALLVSRHATDVDTALTHAGRGLLMGVWWLRPDSGLIVGLDVCATVAVLAGALLLHALLRPTAGSDGHLAAEHARAARLLSLHARDSLDPFALRADKAFHFAAGGFVAYRVLRETAVVAGDPVGPPGAAARIMASFLAFAERQGWDVVATAVSDRSLPAYRALGLRALRIGDEAIVDPRGFSLEGRAIRKVRQSANRAQRRGWRIETVAGDRLAPETVEQLATVEAAWRAGRRRLQGFAMTLGRLWGAEEDGASVYVIARGPEGEVRAFLRFATFVDGMSLDVMRRLDDAPNGLNEALVVEALAFARDRGMSRVSLNFAGLAHIMAADAALSRSQRLARRALRRAHGRFQLERLVRFNEKFAPEWQPRYLLYGRLTSLPLAALRVLQAESYVRPPRRRELTRRWEPDPMPVAAPPVALAEPGAIR